MGSPLCAGISCLPLYEEEKASEKEKWKKKCLVFKLCNNVSLFMLYAIEKSGITYIIYMTLGLRKSMYNPIYYCTGKYSWNK